MSHTDRLNRLLTQTPDALSIGSHALGHALAGDAEASRRCVEDAMSDRFLLHGTHPLWEGRYKMIIRTYPVMGVAFAADLIGDQWEDAFRERVMDALVEKGYDILTGGGEGWNPNTWSNWAGITAGTGSAGVDRPEKGGGSVPNSGWNRGQHHWKPGRPPGCPQSSRWGKFPDQPQRGGLDCQSSGRQGTLAGKCDRSGRL